MSALKRLIIKQEMYMRSLKKLVFKRYRNKFSFTGTYSISMVDRNGCSIIFPDTGHYERPVKNEKEFGDILMLIEMTKGEKASLITKTEGKMTVVIASFM